MTNNFFGFTPIPTTANHPNTAAAALGAANVKRKSRSWSFDEDSNREVSLESDFLFLPSFLLVSI
jgi:hypothetical protein